MLTGSTVYKMCADCRYVQCSYMLNKTAAIQCMCTLKTLSPEQCVHFFYKHTQIILYVSFACGLFIVHNMCSFEWLAQMHTLSSEFSL